MPNFISLYISFIFRGFRRPVNGCRAITGPVFYAAWPALAGKETAIAVILYFSIVPPISQ